MKTSRIVLLVYFLTGLAARAIITGDNSIAETDPSGINGLNWNDVYNYKNSSAVAVDPYWILTAAHVADDPPGGNLMIGSTTYYQQEIVYHATADLALVRYDKTLPGYYDLYSGPLYAGDDILMVGFGNTGTVSATSYTDSGGGNGTKRWGRNEIDSAGWLGDTYVLGAGFNQSATTLEAGVGFYDSGGGSFIHDGGEWKLVGINISRGPSSPYTDSYMASIPTYESWVTGVVPEPGTSINLAIIAVVFAVTKRLRYMSR
jgi:hypothetical protein